MDLASTLNIITSVVISLGGSSVVVFGLSGFIGKIWANRLMEKDKNEYKKQLEELKANHQRELEKLKNRFEIEFKSNEQFHQISQKTYEKLFEGKISTYISLIKEKTEYLKTLHEDEGFEIQDYPPQVYYNNFQKMREIIDQNRLYISNDLSESFDKLYFKIAPILREIGLADVYGDMNNLHFETIQEKKDKEFTKMITETSSDMNALLQQIDLDVIELRKKIDVDVL